MLINKYRVKKSINLQSQNGFALIASMVILVILTVIGVSASDMNSTQMIMARNHQYYNESFYAVNSEVEAQINEIIDYSKNNSNIHPALINLDFDGNPQSYATVLPVASAGLTSEKNEYAFVSQCFVEGNSVGLGVCRTYQLNTAIRATHTSIGSDQLQQFMYLSLIHI